MVARVAAKHTFTRTPGAVKLSLMADGAWRGIALFMLVHFAAAKRRFAGRLSTVPTEDGYRPTGERAYSPVSYSADRLIRGHWM